MKAGSRIDVDAALAAWPSTSPDTESAVLSINAKLEAEPAAGSASLEALFAEPLPVLAGEDAEKTSASVRAVGFEGIERPSSSAGPSSVPSRHEKEPTRAKSEGSMTQQAERRRDRTSFQELAKLAQTPPPPSVGPDSMGPKSGPLSGPVASSPLSWPSAPSINNGPWSGADSDSGMVDLKSMTQSDPAAADRAKSTPLAAEGLFEDPPAPSERVAAAPAPAPSSAAAAAAISSAPVAAAVSASPSVPAPVSAVAAVPQPSAKPKKRGGVGAGALISLVAVLGAVGAGGFIILKKMPRAEAPVAVAQAPKAAPEVKQPEPAAPAPAEPTAAEAQPASPEPVAEQHAAATVKNGKHRKGGPKIFTTGEAPKEAVAEAPAKEKDPKAVAGFTGALKDEMEKRAGGDKKGDEKVEVADDRRGFQPKPSQGQVTGAIGAVLMKARECLGPDDAVSKANVVFGSSGAVQSVSVSGGAVGKPAEGCIKAALGKAKVPAFGDPTYSFPVTVRPL